MNKFIKEIAKQIKAGLKQGDWELLNNEFEVDGVMYQIKRNAQIIRIKK